MSEANENTIVEETAEAVTEEATEAAADKITAEEAVPEATEATPDKKAEKKSKAPLIVALCALIAIIVGGLAFVFGSGYDKTFDPLFFMSYDGVYMKDLGTGKKEAVKILEADGEEDYLSGILLNSSLTEALISLTNENGTALYSYNLADSSSAPVKIADNVNSVVKDEATGIITCSVGEDSRLVQYDSQLNETTVAEKADSFTVSADGLSLFYSIDEGGCYLVQNGKPAVELTKTGTAEYYDDNLTFFYILEDESLYKVTATGEKTLIDKNVASTSFSGIEGYYYKTVKTINIKNLFEDDMAESDNEIKIPADTDSEAYQLYTQRLTRDQIRTIIINPETNYSIQDLYYFDGTSSKNVLKNVYGDELYYYMSSFISSDTYPESVSCNCSVIDTSKIKKVRMSELWEIVQNDDFYLGGLEDITDLITESFTESCVDYFVYKGDFVAEININDIIYGSVLDDKNKLLYVTAGDSVFDDADLYKLPVLENGLGKAELVCESVNSLEATVSEDGKLYYIEEIYPDEEAIASICKVYYNSELIADNVSYVSEYDLERQTFVFEKYQLNEDGTPDIEAYPYTTVLYNAATDKEIVLNSESEEYYYSLYETPAGKTILLESDYGYEEIATSIYTVDSGKKKLLITIKGEPDYYSSMPLSRSGTGYFAWEDEEFWDGEEFWDIG